jgi:hypothetical protein
MYVVGRYSMTEAGGCQGGDLLIVTALPQVDEAQTPRLKDAAREYSLYDKLQGTSLNQKRRKAMLYTILIVLLILLLLGYL